MIAARHQTRRARDVSGGVNRFGGDHSILFADGGYRLNSAERYYTAFTLVLAVAVVCMAILEHEARYLPTIR